MKVDFKRSEAFTLMEVMFAMAIFFVAIFAILELSTRSLKIAESLQRSHADPAMIAAEFAAQAELEDGSDSGDFGDAYPNASWEATVEELLDGEGNPTALYDVRIFVRERVGRRAVVTGLQIWLFRPQQGGRGVSGAGLSGNLGRAGLSGNRGR